MTIKRYREKPPEYEAVQFTGSFSEIEELLAGDYDIGKVRIGADTSWSVTSPRRFGETVWIRPGQWLARDVRKGGLSVWTDDEWRARVEESPS